MSRRLRLLIVEIVVVDESLCNKLSRFFRFYCFGLFLFVCAILLYDLKLFPTKCVFFFLGGEFGYFVFIV